MRNCKLTDAPTRILFADIDGVLNGHDYCEVAESCSIKGQCVGHLNRVVRDTGCRIVVSSAWRYMIGEKGMTMTGFHYLLRTHGVTAKPHDLIWDVTRRDLRPDEKRGVQILEWLLQYRAAVRGRRVHFCILDDLSAEEMGIDTDPYLLRRFVRTNPKSGLNEVSAQQVVDVFAEQDTDDAQDFVERHEDFLMTPGN